MTLYRTYRPRRFADLIGQELVRTVLQQALAKDRIAHAYLFTGPRGTGKTSAARIFVKALCCLDPLTKKGSFEPCLACEACASITQSSSTDVIEIDAASNRGIEDIRTLREQAQYPPAQLKYKIYIIDECHMLSNEAFNALLKTLEEPPARCIFILATTELHKVPLTIRSRCQLLRFERGSTDAIRHKLDAIVADNTWRVEDGVTDLIANFADGGFRDAETVLEQLVTHHDELTKDLVSQTLGTLPTELCESLLDAALSGNISVTHALLREHFQSSDLRHGWVIQEMISLVRNRPRVGAKEIFALEKLLEASLLQRTSPVPSLPLEIAALSIAAEAPGNAVAHTVQITADMPRPSKQKLIEELPATIAPTGSKNTSMDKVKVTPIAPPAPQSVPVVELRDAPAGSTADVRKAWSRAIEKVSKDHPPLAALLRETQFHLAENGTVTVYARYKFHVEKLNEKKNRALLEDLLASLTNYRWQICYELNQAIPSRQERKKLAGTLTSSDISTVFETKS